MFEFLSMIGDYEDRKVARYKNGDVFVDTCRVTDSDQPYETAVIHPAYNNNHLIVVEMYNSKEEA